MPPRGWRKHGSLESVPEPEPASSRFKPYGSLAAEPEPVKKPAACSFCGANPMQPTRDGKHKCQCRREPV